MVESHDVFVGSLNLRSKSVELMLHSQGIGRIFGPAEKFDQTLCSHGTFLYFHFVHTEIWTARRLIFRTVKMVPWEQNT